MRNESGSEMQQTARSWPEYAADAWRKELRVWTQSSQVVPSVLGRLPKMDEMEAVISRRVVRQVGEELWDGTSWRLCQPGPSPTEGLVGEGDGEPVTQSPSSVSTGLDPIAEWEAMFAAAAGEGDGEPERPLTLFVPAPPPKPEGEEDDAAAKKKKEKKTKKGGKKRKAAEPLVEAVLEPAAKKPTPARSHAGCARSLPISALKPTLPERQMAYADAASESAEPVDGSARKEKEKRTSRACLTCRKRKSACHLPTVDGVVTTPCERCKATGQECIIGGSNRGGRRVRRKTQHLSDSSLGGEQSAIDSSLLVDNQGSTTMYNGVSSGYLGGVEHTPGPAMMIDPSLQSGPDATVGANAFHSADTRESSTGAGIAFDDLQNPSDALGILAQIASNGGKASVAPPMPAAYPDDIGIDSHYALIKTGKVTWTQVSLLVQRYKEFYHPYFPLVPARTLDTNDLRRTSREEPHLLTAILVIASRDLTDYPDLFTMCAEHMRSLVSALAAGGPGNVEAVEALLLLAEWTPYTSRSDAGHVGRGEEDREAWMHVGTALRIGYYLGLDRYSFAVRGDDAKDPQWQRKRLVWTACYISDRQISIRLGRAFWSRGPGPLTTLRKEDFPMLAPAHPGDEDFASIFQATLELTLLFSNVHDVLYSNPGNSMRSHLSGGYIKYIDDFRSAIYGWKSVWGTLTCSANLKATLLMSYDYLRLYTNAFAFHATVKRALPQMQGQAQKQSSHPAPGRVFYNNVGAVGDARFIYEGLDAAKSLLSMFNTFVDPEKSLRYMPLRFYLYSVYSGVFLYRARSVGVLSADEEQSVRTMVAETVNRLERSGIGSQHPGNRYSQLLRLLWDKVDRTGRRNARNSTATLTNPYRPGSSTDAAGPASDLSTTLTKDSPAVTELMGDFSWTDLDAIGNFAVNGNGGGATTDAPFWSGFLPADYSSNFLFDDVTEMDVFSMAI